MRVLNRLIGLYLLCTLGIPAATAQQIPWKPVSYRVFYPFVLNPAIAGSRDYSSLRLTASFQGDSKAQMAAFDTRLMRTEPGYFSSPPVVTFRKTAIGGYVFNEKNPVFHNAGAAATFAWHIPLNHENFSFLSFGTALKGYFSSPGISGGFEKPDAETKGLHVNLDLGAYYYGPNAYAGISGVNLFDTPQDSVIAGRFRIPVSRRYFLMAGYKLLLLRKLDIILEPSLIARFGDLETGESERQVQPVIRLYLQNFCLGTYFHNPEKNAFFFEYRYPRFYLGGYFELPKESPYYPKDVIVEITAGINFSKDRSGFSGHGHW